MSRQYRVTERVVIEANTCVRCENWSWGQHHRQLDPTGWQRMEKGELVGVDAPDRILHQPEDVRIQSFLRTYHERNSF